MKIKCNYERAAICAQGEDICWQQTPSTCFYFDAYTTIYDIQVL